ncbi:MAG: S-layer homology domain-containing protein [Oscillospiraceae bacterium]|nr:S-layer homology domain-containing protein [Oscillospiraceae bacterium]
MKSRALAFFIVFCMLLTLFPAVASADGATLAYAAPIYVSETDVNGEPTGFAFDPAEAIIEDPIAIYVSGASTYVLAEDLRDTFLFVSGSSVVLEDVGRVYGDALFVCGGGRIDSNGLVIESGSEAAPENASANELVAYARGLSENEPLFLSGDINEIFTVNKALIKSGTSVVIKSAPEGSDPNGLNITASLKLEGNAGLTAEAGQILEIRKGASVKGLTLYDCDGVTEFSDFSNTETFNYDSASGKWIRCSDGTDPGTEPGGEPEFDLAKAKSDIEGRDFAYCGSAEEIKAYMAQELWAEFFGVLYRWNGERFEAAHTGEFSGMFGETKAPSEYSGDDLVCVVSDAFMRAFSLSEQKPAGEGDILDLPYYEYSIALPDGKTAAEGKVFILEKATQFVVRIGGSYVIADSDGLAEGDDLVLQAEPENGAFDADVFGNGVCIAGGLDAGSESIWAGHVTQERSGLDIGPINCRLVIVPVGSACVRIDGETWAAPWGFGNVSLFPVGTKDAPARAVVYYGNSGAEGRRLRLYKSAFDGDPDPVAHVEIDVSRLSASAATVYETAYGYFYFDFHTDFGVIPLIVTFSDGSKGYIDLERTGLDIAEYAVEGGKYRVRHGIDSTEYASEAERVVTGSFYYATGSDTPDESVKLLVTVETASGTETREIARMNGDYIETEGADKWCDDFLLWSGRETEWADVISVTAEVVPAGGNEAAEITLTAEATASSVTFSGEADCVAVTVQLLNGENILASDNFTVLDGAFSGKFDGLSLQTGKTYSVRAASVDGGEWVTVEVKVPSAPNPSSPSSPPSGGGSSAAKKYTLTFDTNGGSEIEPVTEKAGTVVDLSLYIPTKAGYTFVCWCGSPTLGDALTEVTLSQDITVFAKWRIACAHGSGCPLSAFSDLDPNAWYHEGIHFCLMRGIMNGIGGGLFDPAGTATRAQIVTMLYRLEGEPAVSGGNPFSDVPEGSFYYKSTAWANAEGIVLGYGDGVFAPDDLITREQAATILYRYAKYKGVDTDAMSANTNTLSYTDVFTISDFARPAMHFCIAIGVINGNNGYLRPADTATRAELAAMFQRFCDAVA